jgi:lysophospholipase L1-like esterase
VVLATLARHVPRRARSDLVWFLLLPFVACQAAPPASNASRPARRPRVLLLGDSISIGYTDAVRQLLADRADVFRPLQADSKPENCGDTGHGLARLDAWLSVQPAWDVIHFNFGLHDLKRVRPGANGLVPSNRGSDPRLRPVADYRENLERIVARLEATRARLVFATTTPVPPEPTRPFRSAEDPPLYNAAAVAVMAAHGVPVNDLFAFARPRLATIQEPRNVHFTREGSALLAEQVAAAIARELERTP